MKKQKHTCRNFTAFLNYLTVFFYHKLKFKKKFQKNAPTKVYHLRAFSNMLVAFCKDRAIFITLNFVRK